MWVPPFRYSVTVQVCNNFKLTTMNPPPHRKLVKRSNDIGHAHFITFSCWQRQKFLNSDRARGWFIESLNKSLEKHDIGCWAYVIMPEHVHLLVYPRQVKYNISKWQASLKIGVNRLAVNFLKQHNPASLAKLAAPQPDCRITYRFWQPGGGVDVNLWTESKIWDKIDYIHKNPVRRGLVESPELWMCSSYRDYAQLGTGLLLIDWDSLPRHPRRD